MMRSNGGAQPRRANEVSEGTLAEQREARASGWSALLAINLDLKTLSFDQNLRAAA